MEEPTLPRDPDDENKSETDAFAALFADTSELGSAADAPDDQPAATEQVATVASAVPGADDTAPTIAVSLSAGAASAAGVPALPPLAAAAAEAAAEAAARQADFQPTVVMPAFAGFGAGVTDAPASARPASAQPASAQPASAQPASAQPASAQPASFFRRHRKAVLITAGALVFALLGTGAVFAGASVTPDPVAVAAPTDTATPTPDPRVVPAVATVASRLRTCSVAELATDSRLGSMQAQVLNAATGEVLFDRGGTTPSRTASVLKVLTAASALSVLGPDYRAETTVVAGTEPGEVVLVGGGDLTLTRLPSGQESVYRGAAHLDELARQTVEAWVANPANEDVDLTDVVLDASFFSGLEWHPSWDRSELTDGYMPEITALQVDGDRDNPTAETSRRSEDPVMRAGEAFAAALAEELSDMIPDAPQIDLNISIGTAPTGAAQLAAVQSPPVSSLIGKSLIVSDNAVAEMLARLVAVESGAGNTFDSTAQATVAGLEGYGIDTSGLSVVDGSGLSNDNSVPPSYLTRLFVKIDAGEDNLGIIFDALPVAGGPSGSLSYSDRFSGDNAVADGSVFAKTGWIIGGYTLAGIIHSEDGTPLTFAIYALDDVGDNAKQAIDTLAAGFYSCGDNLSNN